MTKFSLVHGISSYNQINPLHTHADKKFSIARYGSSPFNVVNK